MSCRSSTGMRPPSLERIFSKLWWSTYPLPRPSALFSWRYRSLEVTRFSPFNTLAASRSSFSIATPSRKASRSSWCTKPSPLKSRLSNRRFSSASRNSSFMVCSILRNWRLLIEPVDSSHTSNSSRPRLFLLSSRYTRTALLISSCSGRSTSLACVSLPLSLLSLSLLLWSFDSALTTACTATLPESLLSSRRCRARTSQLLNTAPRSVIVSAKSRRVSSPSLEAARENASSSLRTSSSPIWCTNLPRRMSAGTPAESQLMKDW
mmetsp:Transcript_30671/g.66086  ORF Transcript_30671/g.66086 Transcript_30671/m.66086 type:complete len:264 (+) Transcript_30671:408-1199(+)